VTTLVPLQLPTSSHAGALCHLLRWIAAAALVLAATHGSSAWSQDQQNPEYSIKAAFLCKFGNYVAWPAGPAHADAAPAFRIGVLASTEFADELISAARGQTVNGQAIVVQRLERGDSLDGLSILFIARTHAARTAEALVAVKDKPVLTVTESDQGLASGAIVNFVIVDNKVRFDVSLGAAERSKLKISARLLGVARQVEGRPS
jgi:hypothetical protein